MRREWVLVHAVTATEANRLTCRTAIRRIKPATGGFSTGSASASCGASSTSSLRHCTTNAIWICIDRSFTPANQGGACVGKTKRGRGRRSWPSPIVRGPVAVHLESATPHEVTLVQATLAQRFVNQLPVRLIGDNAYESDRLDAELARRGVELIAPHRRTRTQRTQTGGSAASLPTAVESRTTLCLVPELSAARLAL
jgi:hypothetical protein